MTRRRSTSCRRHQTKLTFMSNVAAANEVMSDTNQLIRNRPSKVFFFENRNNEEIERAKKIITNWMQYDDLISMLMISAWRLWKWQRRQWQTGDCVRRTAPTTRHQNMNANVKSLFNVLRCGFVEFRSRSKVIWIEAILIIIINEKKKQSRRRNEINVK